MTKLSFCTGINNYEDPRNCLRGCINDSTFWHYQLTHEMGFNGSIINDKRVTYQAVTDEIQRAASILVPGDWFTFTYSGHGSQVPDKNNDEADGMDECICLYDKWLIDDDLRKLFDLFKPGVNITFISDSCHSGTNTRAMIENPAIYRVPKFLMPPNEKHQKLIGKLPVKKGFVGVLNFGKTEENMTEILLTGCKSSEYSYDASFNGQFYGAMTYNSMQVLKGKSPMTWNDFYTRLRKLLPSGNYPQTPLLEGKAENKNKIMFT